MRFVPTALLLVAWCVPHVEDAAAATTESIEELRQAYEANEQAARSAAIELRERQLRDPTDPELPQKKEALKALVAKSFALRQQLHQQELDELERKLAAARSAIELRSRTKDEIIEQRVEELLKTSPSVNEKAPGTVDATRRQETAAAMELRLAYLEPAERRSEFTDVDGDRKLFVNQQPIATNVDVASAKVIDNLNGELAIEVSFTEEATQRLREATARHVGSPLAILVDGKLTAAPIIRTAITGKGVMTGKFDREEAERIASALNLKRETVPEAADLPHVVDPEFGLRLLKSFLHQRMILEDEIEACEDRIAELRRLRNETTSQAELRDYAEGIGGLQRTIEGNRSKLDGIDNTIKWLKQFEKISDTDRLQGTWQCVAQSEYGKAKPPEYVKDVVMLVSGNRFSIGYRNFGRNGTFKLASDVTPKQIDMTDAPNGEKHAGIYAFENGQLVICLSSDETRPTTFESKPDGPNASLMRLERVEQKPPLANSHGSHAGMLSVRIVENAAKPKVLVDSTIEVSPDGKFNFTSGGEVTGKDPIRVLEFGTRLTGSITDQPDGSTQLDLKVELVNLVDRENDDGQKLHTESRHIRTLIVPGKTQKLEFDNQRCEIRFETKQQPPEDGPRGVVEQKLPLAKPEGEAKADESNDTSAKLSQALQPVLEVLRGTDNEQTRLMRAHFDNEWKDDVERIQALEGHKQLALTDLFADHELAFCVTSALKDADGKLRIVELVFRRRTDGSWKLEMIDDEPADNGQRDIKRFRKDHPDAISLSPDTTDDPNTPSGRTTE